MMGIFAAARSPSEVIVEAKVTRANGRIEHLGVISYWHKNPIKRLIRRMKRWLI